MLKPQDILVALKLVTAESWTYTTLSATLGLSLGECHHCIKRLASCHLYDGRSRAIHTPEFTEFLLHGVRYAFPAERRGMATGLPTAWGRAPLRDEQTADDDIPVWPSPEGTVRGWELTPLYPSVPFAASQDERLYELLALVDGLREGDEGQRVIAGKLLDERLSADRPKVAARRASAAPRRKRIQEISLVTPEIHSEADSPIEGIMRRLQTGV